MLSDDRRRSDEWPRCSLPSFIIQHVIIHLSSPCSRPSNSSVSRASPTGPGSSFRRASRSSSGRTARASRTSSTPSSGCLGEQSVKSLRGQEMADVIFNGSGSRRAMNTAEITLTFDNSKHLLADRHARGPHHPPRLSQRRGRVSDQPQSRPAPRHPRPALRHRHGHAGLQRHRAGQGRRAAAIVGHATAA